MSEVVERQIAHQQRPFVASLFWRIAWRNVWRNRRRSYLTIGGIGFAMLLLVFVPAAQKGMFGLMIDNATRLLTGHVQVQKRGYADDPRVESTVSGFAALRQTLVDHPNVLAVGGRAYAFVLASANDRSVGVQLMGVIPDVERRVSSLPEHIVAGRYIEGGNEVVAGAHLVHNLALSIGDEVVMLGNAVGGGVAALVLELVGVLETGQGELDRTLLQVDLGTFADAFAMKDEVHAVVIRLDDYERAAAVAADIEPSLPPGLVALPWDRLIPEVKDTIEIKHITADVLFVVLLLLVVFSVVNTFIMTVYERTRELGMLLAIGMRRGRIVRMLHAEALLLTLVGVTAGVLIATTVVLVLQRVGISLGAELGEMLRQYHMPDKLRPAFNPLATAAASIAMIAATQLAAAVATLRIRRLTPVDALRSPQ